MFRSKNKRNIKGFTLVELLVVIAVIGILAAVILVVVNPAEQMARGRDSSRKTAISQLGRALEGYGTQMGVYPASAAAWGDDLISKAEIKNVPNNVTTGIVVCTGNVTNGFCYQSDSVQRVAIVYTRLESHNEANKYCGGTVANTWFVWSSADSKVGGWCGATEPTAGLTGLK